MYNQDKNRSLMLSDRTIYGLIVFYWRIYGRI